MERELSDGELSHDSQEESEADGRLYCTQDAFNSSWSWLGQQNLKQEPVDHHDPLGLRRTPFPGNFGGQASRPRHEERQTYGSTGSLSRDERPHSNDTSYLRRAPFPEILGGQASRPRYEERQMYGPTGSLSRDERQHFNDTSYFVPSQGNASRARSEERPDWQPGGRSTPRERDTQQQAQPHYQRSTLRFHRPQPLAENIPVAEKYERWLDWKGSFDVALTVCEGTPSEQQKVGLLFTSVGTETQKTIKLLGLPPMHHGGWEAGDEYSELSRGLNKFFRGMVDETIDYARFHDAKQGQAEDIHRYTMRLRELAVGINISPASFGFRHQLLKGMRNRELAAKASDDNIPLGELIPMAARKEQREASEQKQKPIDPWQTVEAKRAEVAAVDEVRRYRAGPSKRSATDALGGHEGAFGKSKQCRYCGLRQHTDKKSCPAKGKSCRTCGKQNHFARVCESKKKGVEVNELNSENEKSEVRSNEIIFAKKKESDNKLV